MNFIEEDLSEEYDETRVHVNIDDAREQLKCNKILNILHFNIRSIRKNYNNLLLYLQGLDIDNVDILILSESWEVTTVSNFDIPGFCVFHNGSKHNKCDGLLAYVRESLYVEMMLIPFSQTNIMRLCLEVGGVSYGVSASYRPPSINEERYIEDLNRYLVELNKCQVEIFVGDININIGDSNCKNSLDYLDCLALNGFVSRINKVTRETESTSSVIDHIFTRVNRLIIDKIYLQSSTIEATITDHYGIFLAVKSPIPVVGSKKPETISTKSFIDFNKLFNYLQNESWSSVLNDNDPQGAYSKFLTLLKEYIKLSTYFKRVTNNQKFKKIQPWITKGLITSIKQRDKMKKLFRRYPTQENKRIFNNYRNTLNSLIKTTKDSYYREKIALAGNDLKKVWATINQIGGRKKANKGAPKKINIDDKIVEDAQGKADGFNEFFSSIGSQMVEEIKKRAKGRNERLWDSNKPKFCSASSSFYIKPTTVKEIINLIATLKNNSAPGPDGIAASLIKKIHAFISIPLVHIINIVFSTGKIPSEWKESYVSPIFKSGDRTKMTNYRPISVINNFAKIFEKCLKERLTNYMERFGLISARQYGFREGLSTADAIEELTNNIRCALNDGEKVLAVFLDLAKAFDTVTHDLLLERLENCGFRGSSHTLFEDYLKNRKQYVKIDDKLSKPIFVNTGIPQGTVLGPLLFLIFINQLSSIPNLDIVSYADDSVITFRGKTWEEARKAAEGGLRFVDSWLTESCLSLNVAKTKFLTFSLTMSTQPDDRLLTIHTTHCINNSSCNCPCIEKVDHVKYLGIFIDQHLRWDRHITYLVERLKGMFHTFYNLRYVLSLAGIIRIYESIVVSILRYGVVIWGSVLNSHLKKLEITQNTVLKIIRKVGRRYNTNKLYSEIGELNIRQIYIYENILNQIKREKTTINHPYPTRYASNQAIILPHFKKTHVLHSSLYHGPKLYSHLPIYLKSNINTRSRKYRSELKRYVMENSVKLCGILCGG